MLSVVHTVGVEKGVIECTNLKINNIMNPRRYLKMIK